MRPWSRRKSVPGTRSAPAAELAVEAYRGRQMFHQKRGAAVHHARVPVISAHPVRGVGGAARFQTNRKSGGLVLRLPVERIVIAAVAEMEEASGCGQEVEGSLGVAAGALEDAAALARPLAGFLEVEEQGKPDRDGWLIAQAARALLQVGLEVKDGVAVLGMTGARQLAQLLSDGVPLAQHQPGSVTW